ncbi:MAG: prepilin-type N-terminal cleavage/methylation domain-containing protein [Candidatus Omnitrophica bacterium]|nr:prepilin-type N-terminal cleavage/methylation domain-containing protein [Candidatus Omnitrophota bacterium]MCG2706735.1 prepilin-type N-terminal cleavage/methylation domain-containing protein [Candidatus Omnitrophota bacterium]
MKKAFTLLELVVVVIILGILATLGLTQYGRVIERSRGAEAKAIAGTIRQYAAAYYMEYGTLTGVSDERLGLGTADDQVPTACRTSHYFSYSASGSGTSVILTATRCTAGGKNPQALAANTLILTSDVSTGVDTWSGTGGY